MSEAEPLHQALPLVADARCRLLVLGSLPGRQSLAQQRYYAHPRNQFWALMSPVVGADLVAMDYAARLDAVRAAGVGLWDVVGAARRRGSLDSALRDVQPRDLQAVMARLPALRAVAFNGASALAIGQRQLAGQDRVPLIALPSSSSAHAIGLEAKRESWTRLRDTLA
jgi:double-stranded uracil-DNA glycosylase